MTYGTTANGDGILINDGTTTYAQDLAAPLSQVLTDGTANYVYGHERLRALNGPWYIGDALGSVRQTLDDAGAVVATTSYDPWGTPQGALVGPFGFTGELHSAGQVYLRARWYAPGQGRFVSEDPFAGFAEMPYSLHAYQYAYSNPVVWTDPTGWFPNCDSPLCTLGHPGQPAFLENAKARGGPFFQQVCFHDQEVLPCNRPDATSYILDNGHPQELFLIGTGQKNQIYAWEDHAEDFIQKVKDADAAFRTAVALFFAIPVTVGVALGACLSIGTGGPVAWPVVIGCVSAIGVAIVEVAIFIDAASRAYDAEIDARREYQFIKDNFPWQGIRCPFSGGIPVPVE